MITPVQIRIARSILKWTVDDLSKKTNISWARIQHLEKIDKFESSHEEKVNKIQIIFENEGLVFVPPSDNHYESVLKKK
tara:strand:+ start:117 stop:353 length:237 start_codon:yes stop_codon:yes gene_type:complete